MNKSFVNITCLFLVFLLLLGCATRRQTGAVIGAAAGGALGELIDDEGEEGLIIGALAGGLLGYAIGDYMDRRDRRQLERTLEKTPDDRTRSWTNKSTGRDIAVTPTDTFTNEQGRPCRAFELEFETSETTKQADGVACQRPNGEWEIVKQST